MPHVSWRCKMNIQMCTEFHIAEFEGIPQRRNRVVSRMTFCEMSPIIIYIYKVGYIPSIISLWTYDGSYITGYQRIKDTQPDVGPTLFGQWLATRFERWRQHMQRGSMTLLNNGFPSLDFHGLKKRNNTVKSNCFNCWSLMFLLSNCHKFQKIPITSSKNHPKFP